MQNNDAITENEVMNWMRKKVKSDGFDTASALAQQFLNEHNIKQAHHPDFPTVIDAS